MLPIKRAYADLSLVALRTVPLDPSRCKATDASLSDCVSAHSPDISVAITT